MFHIVLHYYYSSVPDDPFPDPDAVITLKLTGLSPAITKDAIEAYISIKADDSDVEVKSVTLLGEGNAIASVSGFVGKKMQIKKKLVMYKICNKISIFLVDLFIMLLMSTWAKESDSSFQMSTIPGTIHLVLVLVNSA